jgi:DNA-binding NtrC family response regulator
VRELENEVGRLMAIHTPGTPLNAERLSPRIAGTGTPTPVAPSSLAEHERELIQRHLLAAAGNRTHAARSLGMSRETLRQRLIKYGLA